MDVRKKLLAFWNITQKNVLFCTNSKILTLWARFTQQSASFTVYVVKVVMAAFMNHVF